MQPGPNPLPHVLRGTARALILAGGLFLADSVQAQAYGQWWWQARLGVGQRLNETLEDSVVTSDYEATTYRLDTDLNGFLLHPTIGRFRLGLDLSLSDFEGSRFEDTTRIGGDLELRLLPGGAYPARLSASVRDFDYTLPPNGNLFVLLQQPARIESWGGEWSLRRGPFKGVILEAKRTDIDYVSPELRRGLDEQQSVIWRRNAFGVSHGLTLRRQRRIFGTTDFEYENLLAYLDEHGTIGEPWTWQVSGTGLHRSTKNHNIDRTFGSYRLFGRLSRSYADGTRFELNSSVIQNRVESQTVTEGFSVAALHWWELKPGLLIGPSLRYTETRTGEVRSTAPAAGVRLTWATSVRGIESRFGVGAGYGRTERDGAQVDTLSYSFQETLSYGRPDKLRTELELELSRNEPRLAARADDTLAGDLFIEEIGFADENGRARLKLSRQLGATRLDLWGDWTRQESDTRLGDTRGSESFSGTLHVGFRRLDLQLVGGSRLIWTPTAEDQDVLFARGSVSWSPLRFLRVGVFYRVDERSVAFEPDLSTSSLDLFVSFTAGLLEFEARLFQIEQEFPGSPLSVRQGFSWTLSRRLRGLLPIVSAPQRRGTVR